MQSNTSPAHMHYIYMLIVHHFMHRKSNLSDSITNMLFAPTKEIKYNTD